VLGIVIGVVGGSGGVGASTFAAVLAAVAGTGVLIDLDPVGGGIDVLLGIEGVGGARWSGLRLGGGRLDPALLAEGLPRWGGVSVLAADLPPPAGAVPAVLEAARSLGPVVLDLGRSPSARRSAGVEQCCLVVLLAAGDVRGLAAARVAAIALSDVRTGLVVRRGTMAADETAQLVGAPLLGELPSIATRGDRACRPGRLPRPEARLAAGILDGVRS
jgi:hypothetical protein